jgi:hypothetical protein
MCPKFALIVKLGINGVFFYHWYQLKNLEMCCFMFRIMFCFRISWYFWQYPVKKIICSTKCMKIFINNWAREGGVNYFGAENWVLQILMKIQKAKTKFTWAFIWTKKFEMKMVLKPNLYLKRTEVVTKSLLRLHYRV